jgi:hypothetical protein
MSLLAACLGGVVGAGAIEISELYGAIRSAKDFPWRRAGEVPLGPYLFSVILRLILGIIAAAVCASAGPLGTLGAVAAGIAAPKLLEEIGRHAPVTGISSRAAPQEAAHPAADRMPQPLSPAAPCEVPTVSAEEGPVNATQ